MTKLRSHAFFKYLVLGFLSAYLFASFSNLFFIPRYSFTGAKAYSVSESAFNKFVNHVNYHKTNFLQIIDKSTLDNDLNDALHIFPKCILLIFIGLGFISLWSISVSRRSTRFYSHRYSYLSFCTFRI